MGYKYTYAMLVLENKNTGDITNYIINGKMSFVDISEIVEEDDPNHECECVYLGWYSGNNKRHMRKEINRLFKVVEKERRSRKEVKK